MTFGPAHELERDAALVEDVVADLATVVGADPSVAVDRALGVYLRLEAQRKALAGVCADLAHLIGVAMDDKRLTAAGVTVERKRQAPRRTNWDSDGLLRLVVDSRVVDESTGEIESVLDVVKKVYPLAGYNARVTALKTLGIDPDEFATTEWSDRWTLRVHGGDR